MGIKAKLYAEFETAEKMQKFTQNSSRAKTFAGSDKSQKLDFPVTFLLITFLREFFATFSTDSKSASSSAFF